MSTEQLISSVLRRAPKADPETVLELIVSCNGDVKKVLELLGCSSSSTHMKQTTFKVMKPKPHQRKQRKKGEIAPIQNLHTAEQVSEAPIYCTLHRNVLDPVTANLLAAKLIEDSPDWTYNHFWLFDKQAHSHHSNQLYTDDPTLLSSRDFMYNGERLSLQGNFFPEMAEARNVVQDIVNNEISKRPRSRYLPKNQQWDSRITVANLFKDRTENLAFHSDQLTHIGPEPIIAGLSLGSTREFRLMNRRHPHEYPIYSIRVPHNSLLIMHSGCQENWKHSIPQVSTLEPDPLWGTMRLSLTYRMYRKEFRTKNLPRCRCNRPMILRTTLNDNYSYIWQCGASYQESNCGQVYELNYDDFVTKANLKNEIS